MSGEIGIPPEKIKEGLQKLAGLAIVIEVAEHTKTAASAKFLSRVKSLFPSQTAKKKAIAESTRLKGQLADTKGQLSATMEELASAERLARGAVYAGGAAVPAAGIGAYVYGKGKGREEGKEAFIRELLGE
jgi:hypothetical protein